MEKLIKEVQELTVSVRAAELFASRGMKICQLVDESSADDSALISPMSHQGRQDMFENHRYHAEFMRNLLRMNNFDPLPWIAVWVYRVYGLRGIPFDYFLIEIREWQKGVRSVLPEEEAQEICAIYEWISQHHHDILHLANSLNFQLFPICTENKTGKQAFLAALLQGDYQSCKDMAEQFVNHPCKIGIFNRQIIQASLYEIGQLWEQGQITVANEHRATAIVYKVMATVYAPFLAHVVQTKGRAVITASVNEFHEAGARMVADQLAVEGWQVHYLGSNMLKEDLIKQIKEQEPFFLGISVAMYFNLDTTRSLIRDIRKDLRLKDLLIIVGGPAFKHSENLWRLVGADGYGENSIDVVQLANSWWKE